MVSISELISAYLEGIFQLAKNYLDLKPEGTTHSFSVRLEVGSEPSKYYFKTGYKDENRGATRGSHPRSPVSYIRVRNRGENHLYMCTNQAPGDAFLSTPIYAFTEWEIKVDKNCIWSLFLQAAENTETVATYTDVVVDFIN